MEEADYDYNVRWEIDLSGASPVEAARRALEIQRDAMSEALVFIVEGGGSVVEVDLQTGETRLLEASHPDVPAAPQRYHCGNCDSPVSGDAAHIVCGHGYMEGFRECGVPYEGGYSLASDPESGPPCQGLVNELEIGILAGNETYREEYKAIRERWGGIRKFTVTRALRDL